MIIRLVVVFYNPRSFGLFFSLNFISLVSIASGGGKGGRSETTHQVAPKSSKQNHNFFFSRNEINLNKAKL